MTQVSLSLASAIEPSSELHSFSSQHITPSANSILFAALSERQRLDRFANIVGFLACADKLSTSVDCFRALDEIASTVFRVHVASESSGGDSLESVNQSPYGVPELNPCGTLGLGIWYWQTKRHLASAAMAERNREKRKRGTATPVSDTDTGAAEPQQQIAAGAEVDASAFSKYMVRWSIRAQNTHGPGNKDISTGNSALGSSNPDGMQQSTSHLKYSARYSTEWMLPILSMNPDSGLVESWNEPDFQPDQKAEFVLLLDPPVYLPYTLAESLDATTEPPVSASSIRNSTAVEGEYYLNNVFSHSHRTVVDPGTGRETRFDVSFSSLVPYSFVKVTEVPIAHPRDLPVILEHLRKAVLVDTLFRSLNLDQKHSPVSGADGSSDGDGVENEDDDDDDEALDSELMLIDALLESDMAGSGSEGSAARLAATNQEATRTDNTLNGSKITINGLNPTNGANTTNNNPETTANGDPTTTAPNSFQNYQTDVSLLEEGDQTYILVSIRSLQDLAFRVSPVVTVGKGRRAVELQVSHVGLGPRAASDGSATATAAVLEELKKKVGRALEMTEDLGMVCAYIAKCLAEQ